jgi:hypothetical protein
MQRYLVPVLLMFCWIGPAWMKADAHTSLQQTDQGYPAIWLEDEGAAHFSDLLVAAEPVTTEPDSSKQNSQVGTMFQQVVDWLYPRQPEADSTKQQ